MKKIILIPALGIFLAGCVSTLDRNLGTNVRVHQNNVVLSWDELHPYKDQFATQRVQLMAEYREKTFAEDMSTEVGPVVREIVSQNRRGTRAQSTRSFSLPTTIRGIPDGNICLYFEMEGQVVPIRSFQSGTDAARFRYAEWEQQVSNNAFSALVARDRPYIQSSKDRAERQLRLIESELARDGLRTPGDCAIQVFGEGQASTSLSRPFDVVEPAEVDTKARQICTYRVAEGGRLYSDPRVLKFLPLLVVSDNLTSFYSSHATASRVGQLNRFITTYAESISAVTQAKNYSPELDGDYIAIPAASLVNFDGAAELIMQELSDYAGEDRNLLLSLFGAELDAFEGCIADSKQQLQTKIDAWEATVENSAGRALERQHYEIKQCESRFSALENAEASFTESSLYLDRFDQTFSEKTESTTQLPAGPVALNQQACTVQ